MTTALIIAASVIITLGLCWILIDRFNSKPKYGQRRTQDPSAPSAKVRKPRPKATQPRPGQTPWGGASGA